MHDITDEIEILKNGMMYNATNPEVFKALQRACLDVTECNEYREILTDVITILDNKYKSTSVRTEYVAGYAVAINQVITLLANKLATMSSDSELKKSIQNILKNYPGPSEINKQKQ